MDTNTGSGAAADATVNTEPGAGDADLVAEAKTRVSGAQSRVDKAKENLAYAQATLETAKADLAAL
jgi:hypothetical protein